MLYVLLIILTIFISFTIILGMLLHTKRKKDVKLELNILGIKADMEVTEDEKE